MPTTTGIRILDWNVREYVCLNDMFPERLARLQGIRIDITDPEQWSAGDTAILRNQEAKKVRDIGSLIFETPIQHDYEAGTEVRSLLPTERLEEIDGRLAVTDEDLHSPGTRSVKFWVDEAPNSPEGSRSHADEELTTPLASARANDARKKRKDVI